MKLNHVLIKTGNLSVMNRFWTECIGLEAGHRPLFSFPGAWLYSDNQPLIHIVEDKTVIQSNSVLSHVALEGANYTQLIETLQANEINYAEMDVPHSCERQVFIQGPEGLNVEMLFDMSRTNVKK